MTQAKQETSTVRELLDEVVRLQRLLGAAYSVIDDRTDALAVHEARAKAFENWRDEVGKLQSRIATLTARNERLMEALKGLVDAVGASKVPQNTRDAAFQLTVTLGPAYINAMSALEASHE